VHRNVDYHQRHRFSVALATDDDGGDENGDDTDNEDTPASKQSAVQVLGGYHGVWTR
jgi:hypothetical protein